MILHWLAYSFCPIIIEEVAEATAVDFDGPKPQFNADLRFWEADLVLEICSSLVTVSDNRVLRFAHYSVKEYLLSNRIRTRRCAAYSIEESASHKILAKSCLAYLS
jgi:hypothetical protein